MNGQLVGEMPTLRHLDRIHIADEIRHRSVRGSQFLTVPRRRLEPPNRDCVAVGGQAVFAVRTDGTVRRVVDLTTLHDRQQRIEQIDQTANEAGLGLATFAEENDVVARQNGPFERRNHRLFETDDPREQFVADPHPRHEVLTQFLLDGAVLPSRLAK